MDVNSYTFQGKLTISMILEDLFLVLLHLFTLPLIFLPVQMTGDQVSLHKAMIISDSSLNTNLDSSFRPITYPPDR